jgi:metal-responsive CopG/Arc/MetJ family transcriptional regulator
MRITISLPEQLASRFLALVPSRERSATIAQLLERELAQRERALEQACLAANADAALTAENAEWQAFDDVLEEPPAP